MCVLILKESAHPLERVESQQVEGGTETRGGRRCANGNELDAKNEHGLALWKGIAQSDRFGSLMGGEVTEGAWTLFCPMVPSSSEAASQKRLTGRLPVKSYRC